MTRKRRKLKRWVKTTIGILFSLVLFISGYMCGLKNGKKVTVFQPNLVPFYDHVLASDLNYSQININKVYSDEIDKDSSELVEEETSLETLKNASNDTIYIGEFLLTGYCDCPICQEEWVGTTALGVPPTEEWTIAVDPDVIPLGSYVWIEGHRYRAEDVGSAIQENHIDMFMPSHEDCYQDICNGYKEVYIEVEEG